MDKKLIKFKVYRDCHLSVSSPYPTFPLFQCSEWNWKILRYLNSTEEKSILVQLNMEEASYTTQLYFTAKQYQIIHSIFHALGFVNISERFKNFLKKYFIVEASVVIFN